MNEIFTQACLVVFTIVQRRELVSFHGVWRFIKVIIIIIIIRHGTEENANSAENKPGVQGAA